MEQWCGYPGLEVFKLFYSFLNSVEHEIFLLIVVILIFISRKKFMLRKKVYILEI